MEAHEIYLETDHESYHEIGRESESDHENGHWSDHFLNFLDFQKETLKRFRMKIFFGSFYLKIGFAKERLIAISKNLLAFQLIPYNLLMTLFYSMKTIFWVTIFLHLYMSIFQIKFFGLFSL